MQVFLQTLQPARQAKLLVSKIFEVLQHFAWDRHRYLLETPIGNPDWPMIWLDTTICSCTSCMNCKDDMKNIYKTEVSTILRVYSKAAQFSFYKLCTGKIRYPKFSKESSMLLYNISFIFIFGTIVHWNTKRVLIRASSTKFCLDRSKCHLRPVGHHPLNHMRGWFYQPCHFVPTVVQLN